MRYSYDNDGLFLNAVDARISETNLSALVAIS